ASDVGAARRNVPQPLTWRSLGGCWSHELGGEFSRDGNVPAVAKSTRPGRRLWPVHPCCCNFTVLCMGCRARNEGQDSRRDVGHCIVMTTAKIHKVALFCCVAFVAVSTAHAQQPLYDVSPHARYRFY